MTVTQPDQGAEQRDNGPIVVAEAVAAVPEPPSLPYGLRQSLLIVAVVLALVADQLFNSLLGASALSILVPLMIAGAVFWNRSAGVKPAKAMPVLAVIAISLALVLLVRREVLTLTLALLGSLLAFSLMLAVYRNGSWMGYGFTTWVEGFVRALVGMGETAVRVIRQAAPARVEGKVTAWHRRLRIAAVLRGLALALPIGWLFTRLLSASDPRYLARMQEIWLALGFEPLTMVGRLLWIAVISLVLIGGFAYAALRSDGTWFREEGQLPWRLGSTEAAVVLIALIGLFGSFVAVEAEYFFGGAALLAMSSQTVAEYARNGFFELVQVALLAWLLLVMLSIFVKRDSAGEKRLFSLLGAVISGLVLVILASAFQRLLLYEETFGFTVDRIAAHVFMVWLGLLFVALVVLELLQRQRMVVSASLLAVVGFTLTLAFLNVEQVVVQQNVGRGAAEPLDPHYLVALTSDATPALAAAVRDPATPAQERDLLFDVLACRSAQSAALPPMLHLSTLQAEQVMRGLQPEIAAYLQRLLPDPATTTFPVEVERVILKPGVPNLLDAYRLTVTFSAPDVYELSCR